MNIAVVSRSRARVIEEFVQIETLIASVISHFYIGRQDRFSFMFSLQVLYDENCSFGMKRNILKKILDSIYTEPDKKQEIKKKFDKLHKINRIRNLFAHCGPDLFITI